MTTNNEDMDSSESIQDVAENSPNDLLDINLATDVRSQPRILDSSLFDSYLQSNEEATWVNKNAPLFDCPDKTILEIYYFRWLVLYRRLHNTPVGYVVEEFPFDVDWANEHNAISAPAALQLREGRWLRNPRYMTEYVKYWFSPGVNPRHYSFWIADAVWDVYRVHHDRSFIADVLQDLVYNYRAWEEVHRDDNGLYWQWDQNDGMEHQAGGSGYRPSINSYMYGDAVAIA